MNICCQGGASTPACPAALLPPVAVEHQILYAFSHAPRFNRWMADTIRPYLGSTILEIGAGIGNLTQHLVSTTTRYYATDIDPDHLASLHSRFANQPNIAIHRCDLEQASDFTPFEQQVDSIVCLNVLEHVGDHYAALGNICRTLRPGGRAIILVPQDQCIYGSLDAALGHHRRYSKRELRAHLQQAGFRVDRLFDFNRISRPAWFLSSRVLKRHTITKHELSLFNLFVPLWRRIDSFLPWPGVSLIAVGVKQ